MEIDEITIPSADFSGGQTFGPVTLDESAREGLVDPTRELPMTFVPQRCRVWGIDWYPQICRTRGIFSVTANRITLRPTAPVMIERAAWWRRCGYWMFTRCHRPSSAPAETRRRMSRT